MNEEKQKVYYKPASSDFIRIGIVACINALTHPQFVTHRIRTSTVQSYDKETGVFETKNTVYIPASEIKPGAPKPTICHKHGCEYER